MTTPSELSAVLREIGLETLNIDIESEDDSLEGLTMERLKRAMQNAFDAGQAMRQKESIEANLLFWQLMESLPRSCLFQGSAQSLHLHQPLNGSILWLVSSG